MMMPPHESEICCTLNTHDRFYDYMCEILDLQKSASSKNYTTAKDGRIILGFTPIPTISGFDKSDTLDESVICCCGTLAKTVDSVDLSRSRISSSIILNDRNSLGQFFLSTIVLRSTPLSERSKQSLYFIRIIKRLLSSTRLNFHFSATAISGLRRGNI